MTVGLVARSRFSACNCRSFIVELLELVAIEVSLAGVGYFCFLLDDHVLGQLWHDVVVIVLVIEASLDEAFIHDSVHFSNVN